MSFHAERTPCLQRAYQLRSSTLVQSNINIKFDVVVLELMTHPENVLSRKEYKELL